MMNKLLKKIGLQIIDIKELEYYEFIEEHASIVYDYVTDGELSYAKYDSKVIKSYVDENWIQIGIVKDDMLMIAKDMEKEELIEEIEKYFEY